MSKFIRVETEGLETHFAALSKNNGGDIEPVLVDGELVAVRIGKHRLSATKTVGLTLHVDIS